MKKIKKMLKSCDNLSPPITLYYKNGDRHASNISGFLTIISYLTITILSVIFSLDFILKLNPTSYFYNKYISDVGFFPLNSSGIFHFIATGEENNIKYDSRAFSIYGVEENADVIKENSNMSLYNHWIYGPCSKSDIDNLKDYLDVYKTSFEQGMCIQKYYDVSTKTIIEKNDINFKYPILAHGNSNPNSNTYGIFLMRCQNYSDEENVNCYSNKESDNFALKSFSFAIYFIDQYADVTNYHYPLTRFYNKIRNQMILESYTINNLNFKPVIIATHAGMLFNEESDLNSFALDVNEKFTIEEVNTGIYGVVYFWMENQAGVYDRTYQKIQEVSASISGVSKLIMIIGYFLNYLIHEFTLINDLRIDISKKTEKFGNKTSTKGITSTNLTGILGTPTITPIISNKVRTPSIQMNNFINETNLSKINLKDNIFYKKKSGKIKSFSCFDVTCNSLSCKPNNNIKKLLTVRMKVLSEEKLITEYYVIGLMSDIILKHNKINNNMLNSLEDCNPKKKIQHYQRKSKYSFPQNRIFLSKESNI
jgi:hypothetical protein